MQAGKGWTRELRIDMFGEKFWASVRQALERRRKSWQGWMGVWQSSPRGHPCGRIRLWCERRCIVCGGM
eukprot:6643842-Prorocentrum_lima.AAC.1